MNNQAQVQVVVAFLKAGKDVNKTKFAAENNTSRRTLDRYVEKYSEEALNIIEAEKNTVVKPMRNALTSKRDLAAKVFSNNSHLKRKDLISLMISKCGLTAAGASTYISNFKTGKWDI
ncbi:hypothetical protein [Aeromonas hydrophila]